MTNHIEEAKKVTEPIENGGLTYYDERLGMAKVHALIAIAEQLQLANRIAVAQDTLLENSGYRDLDGIMLPQWKPEIAELLGVKE